MADVTQVKAMAPQLAITPTDVKVFRQGTAEIRLEVEDSVRGLYWRLIVDGDEGYVTRHYAGLYSHKGWFVATAYWDGILPVFVPFQITEVKS